MTTQTTDQPPRKHAGDPDCFCRALHLPPDALADGDGHCLCRCHGDGAHQFGDPACPCNEPNEAT